MTRQIFRKYTFFILSIFHFIWGQISDFKVKEYFPLPHRISELGLKPTKFNWSIGERFILIDEVKNQIQKHIHGMPGQEKMVIDYYKKLGFNFKNPQKS